MGTSLGNRITKLRTEREWTPYRLAKNSGLSYSYLTALEEDKHSPSLEVIQKIAGAFGIEPYELLKEDGEIEQTTDI